MCYSFGVFLNCLNRLNCRSLSIYTGLEAGAPARAKPKPKRLGITLANLVLELPYWALPNRNICKHAKYSLTQNNYIYFGSLRLASICPNTARCPAPRSITKLPRELNPATALFIVHHSAACSMSAAAVLPPAPHSKWQPGRLWK